MRLPRYTLLCLFLLIACEADTSALRATPVGIGLGLTALDRQIHAGPTGTVRNRDESILQVNAAVDGTDVSVTGLAVGTARVSFRSDSGGCIGPSTDHDARIRVAPVAGADVGRPVFNFGSVDRLEPRPDLGPLVVGMSELVPVRYRDTDGEWLAGGGRALVPTHLDVEVAPVNMFGDDQLSITPSEEGAVVAAVDLGEGLTMEVRYEGVAAESLEYAFEVDPPSGRVVVHAHTPDGVEVALDHEQLVLTTEGEPLLDDRLPASPSPVPVCAAVVGHEVCALLTR